MLMGSGETSPTMVTAHREIFRRLPKDAAAVIIDTPFGFQENADDIAGRAQEYFRNSINVTLEVATLRNSATATSIEVEKFANAVRVASYLFAGPGSPTYALRQWATTNTAHLLKEKLEQGGVVAFSSAAVSTLGRFTIPVYEIYKVGEDPALKDGLDVLSSIGLDVLVVPHFNNAEGGNHDTRYCYMGELRLRMLEAQLPDETAILGLDEHTGLIIDLNADTVDVVGIGGVTLRKNESREVLLNGTSLSFKDLKERLRKVALGELSPIGDFAIGGAETTPRAESSALERSPLLKSIEAYLARFDEALLGRDSSECIATILDLDAEVVAWAADTLQSDDLEKGRSTIRSMVTRLEPVLREGFVPLRNRLAPFVEALLEMRAAARDEKRWGDADMLRDRLDGLGVVVRDTPGGVEWHLSS